MSAGSVDRADTPFEQVVARVRDDPDVTPPAGGPARAGLTSEWASIPPSRAADGEAPADETRGFVAA